MKKLLLTALMAAGLSLHAQDFYNFSVSEVTYQDLQDATSMNSGEVWDFDDFPEVQIPFEAKIFGQTINRFLFEDDYFVFLAPGATTNDDEGVFYADPVSYLIQDRTYSSGNSSSSINYKVEGAEGSRILKLEIKNAGLETYQDYGVDEDFYYLNYQIWIYEADNAVEYRYGASNITDDVIEEEGLFVSLLSDSMGGLLSGASNAPSYDEYTPQTIPDEIPMLSSHPTENIIYRFAPATTAGIPAFAANKFAVYPNPASGILNLNTGNATISGYSITDATGKVVSRNTAPATGEVRVNVENLAPGMYFINANGQYIKFIKK